METKTAATRTQRPVQVCDLLHRAYRQGRTATDTALIVGVALPVVIRAFIAFETNTDLDPVDFLVGSLGEHRHIPAELRRADTRTG